MVKGIKRTGKDSMKHLLDTTEAGRALPLSPPEDPAVNAAVSRSEN